MLARDNGKEGQKNEEKGEEQTSGAEDYRNCSIGDNGD